MLDFKIRSISKKYLEIIVGVNFTNLDDLYQDISNIQKLRNCIVHNNSCIIRNRKIDLNKQTLYKFVKNNKNLMINESNGTFVIVNDNLLLEFTDKIEVFLIQIINKLKSI